MARFGDRLRTHIHVEHAAGGRRIASFLLQPLVENAVKYGRREEGLDIHIDIRAEGDVLHIQIDNTGSLHVAWHDDNAGNWNINYRSRDGGGTWSTISAFDTGSS